MAQLPICPTFREGKCERSDLILVGETETFFTFWCRTCHLEWVWTKPRIKEAARYFNELEKVKEKTRQYREQDSRGIVFGSPKGGWL